jgi:hypothetical protein
VHAVPDDGLLTGGRLGMACKEKWHLATQSDDHGRPQSDVMCVGKGNLVHVFLESWHPNGRSWPHGWVANLVVMVQGKEALQRREQIV